MQNANLKTEAREVNGVNVTALFETIEAVKANPQIAAFEFAAANRWQGGALNRTTIGDYYGALETHKRTHPFVFDNDEAPVLLGEDRAPNPVEWVLHALAGCLTTSITYHAAARNIAIEGIESEFKGKLDLNGFLGLDPEVRKGYRQIDVKFRVKTDARPETIRQLAKFSPVYEMISASVPVNLEIETTR